MIGKILMAIGAIIVLVTKGLFWEIIGMMILIAPLLFKQKKRNKLGRWDKKYGTIRY